MGDTVKILEATLGVPQSVVGKSGVVALFSSLLYMKVDVEGTEWAMSAHQVEWIPFPATPLTGSYAERQKQWLEHHGLKVGDKVKVVRKFEEDEDGYTGYTFNNRHLGQTAAILRISSLGVKIDVLSNNDSKYHPYFALEPVK